MVSNWARQDFPAWLLPCVSRCSSPSPSTRRYGRRTLRRSPSSPLFSGAPRFMINRQSGAGHNISLGHTAPDYHGTVFSFAEHASSRKHQSPDVEAG